MAASRRADGRARKNPWPYAGEPLIHPDPPCLDLPSKRAERLRKKVPVIMTLLIKAEAPRAAPAAGTGALLVGYLASETAAGAVLVPRAQSEGVMDAQGRQLRAALARETQWIDPENQDPNARGPKMVKGYRAADPLITLHAGGKGDVTTLHLIAATRYRTDYEVGILGARENGNEPQEVRASSYGGMTPTEAQLDALRSYQGAVRCLGLIASGITNFVVLGINAEPGKANLKAWSDKKGERFDQAKGRLLAALDRLTEYYEVSRADLERAVS